MPPVAVPRLISLQISYFTPIRRFANLCVTITFAAYSSSWRFAEARFAACSWRKHKRHRTKSGSICKQNRRSTPVSTPQNIIYSPTRDQRVGPWPNTPNALTAEACRNDKKASVRFGRFASKRSVRSREPFRDRQPQRHAKTWIHKNRKTSTTRTINKNSSAKTQKPF